MFLEYIHQMFINTVRLSINIESHFVLYFKINGKFKQLSQIRAQKERHDA